MAYRVILDVDYTLAKSDLTEAYNFYEQGMLTDAELARAEASFRELEEQYYQQFEGDRMLQLQFEKLCELVGKTMREFGALKSPKVQVNKYNKYKDEVRAQMNRTRDKTYELIQMMLPNWDKGCIYYPHPRMPNSWRMLPHDLCDRKVRQRARDRNRRDLELGRPFRGFCELLSPDRYL